MRRTESTAPRPGTKEPAMRENVELDDEAVPLDLMELDEEEVPAAGQQRAGRGSGHGGREQDFCRICSPGDSFGGSAYLLCLLKCFHVPFSQCDL